MAPPLRRCELCGSPATKRCAKCLASYYCSAECQRKDYQSHNGICVLRRTRDVALRAATHSSSAAHCVSFFRLEAAQDPIHRGRFDYHRGTCTLLTPTDLDIATRAPVVLHTRNQLTGDRAALLCAPGPRTAAPTWHAIDVANVFADPPAWLRAAIADATASVLAAWNLHATDDLRSLDLSPQDRLFLDTLLPRLINVLKAHCCEEGEDDVRQPPAAPVGRCRI